MPTHHSENMLVCPSCGRRLAVPPNASGKKGQCKRCGATISIPVASSAPDQREEHLPARDDAHLGKAGKIFISYRRSDAADAAGRIYDRLCSHFGPRNVFKDVDSIPVGADFKKHIETVICESRCLVVVIGERWLDCRDADGNRRLDNPDDFVRLEIERAFCNRRTVIPALVDNARMPKESDLPIPLQRLAGINAATVRAGREFDADIKGLIKAIGDQRRITWCLVAAATAVLFVAVIITLTARALPTLPQVAQNEPKDIPTITIVPKTYTGRVQSKSAPSNGDTIRPQSQSLAGRLLVDAIVSEFDGVYFLDVRLANSCDEPQMLSALAITAKAINSKFIDSSYFSNNVAQKSESVSQNYDVDVSQLVNPGDSITAILSQVVPPRSTDRFVVSLHGEPKCGHHRR